MVLIQPATVQRDENGYWTHPALPEFDEGDSAKCKEWQKAQGLEISHVCLESEDLDHAAYVAYFENEESTCAQWEPPRPEGEGWFMLAIDDTEDGPTCWWARRTPEAQ